MVYTFLFINIIRYNNKNIFIVMSTGIAKRATHSDDSKCSCVLTVPEFFDDPSRESVRNAAVQAGWNVLQVVNAPSITPFTYGINVSEPLNDTYVTI